MRRLIAAFLVLYAAAIVVWLLARAIWGDQLLVLALLNSLPVVPFVLTPVALLLAAIDRRPLSIIAALLPAILWLAFFGWRFIPRGSEVTVEQQSVRVMALNVLVRNRIVDAMVAAIAAEQPDIVALAELTGSQNAALAAAIGDVYPYRTVQRLGSSSYGVGIYSRWPMEELGSLQTGQGLRSAVADVATPQGTLRFVGVHLRSVTGSSRAASGPVESLTEGFRGREAQIEAICGYIDQWQMQGEGQDGIPVIVAGDFNMGEFSDAYRCMGSRMVDAFKRVGRGYGFTWPSSEARMGRGIGLLFQARIDYIFHSRRWRTVEARTLSMPTGSDHRAVVATLAND